MILGFIGIADNYLFIPVGLSLTVFFGAIAYAGSGGNLLLSNSFYVLQERKKEVEEVLEDKKSATKFLRLYKIIFLQNTVFFFGGGLLIIILLSYISFAVLGGANINSHDFSFLITEANIFSKDIAF